MWAGTLLYPLLVQQPAKISMRGSAVHPSSHSHHSLTSLIIPAHIISTLLSTLFRQHIYQVRYQCLTNSYGPIDSIFE